MDKYRKETRPVLGPSVLISIVGRKLIPAKIDTGAEASSIWASHIRVGKDGILRFRLFGEKSPYYNGKVIKRKDYSVMVARSAMGQEQIRYTTHIPIIINERKIRVRFSLTDRSRNSFPVLIGKRTLQGKFIVDVSLPDVEYEQKPKQQVDIKTFKKDPYKFHKKYIKERSKIK